MREKEDNGVQCSAIAHSAFGAREELAPGDRLVFPTAFTDAAAGLRPALRRSSGRHPAALRQAAQVHARQQSEQLRTTRRDPIRSVRNFTIKYTVQTLVL